jgi:hypothetical protein
MGLPARKHPALAKFWTDKRAAGFAEYVGQFSKTREDVNTWFDAVKLDDYGSFGGKV